MDALTKILKSTTVYPYGVEVSLYDVLKNLTPDELMDILESTAEAMIQEGRLPDLDLPTE